MEYEQLSPAYLVIKQGPQAGKRVEIWKDCTTIGRSRECDIFLEDIAVHRKQARIVFTRAGYALQDDHGSGDSIVNGSFAAYPSFWQYRAHILFSRSYTTVSAAIIAGTRTAYRENA